MRVMVCRVRVNIKELMYYITSLLTVPVLSVENLVYRRL